MRGALREARRAAAAASRTLRAAGAPDAPLSRRLHRDARGYTHFDDGGGWRSFRPSQNQLRVAGALTAAGGLVYVTHLEPVPITGRSHLILCSVDTERALGKQAVAQVLAQHRGQLLPPSSPASQRVTRVGARVVDALTEDERLRRLPHLKGARWRFHVIDSPDCNAFVVPGGEAFVFTGLLRAFPEDDALAMVLAHEVSHVIARHSAEKVSQYYVGTLLKIALAQLTGVQGVSEAVVELSMSLPFSRRAESEADKIGILLMAKACYDPAAAPVVFQRLAKLHSHGGGAPPAWLSTHPADKDRVKALQAMAEQAERAYADAGCAETQAALGEAGIALGRRTRAAQRGLV